MSNFDPGELPTLPEGVRSRFVDGVNGLRMHVLEAGYDDPGRPCIVLLHGFPELAYSWRRVMPGLAAAGFHVVAPDQRGYGRTTGWSADYDGDLTSFHILNLVRDAAALVTAIGRDAVAAVVGHDFGSPVAAYCALTRPEVFQSVALMSAPFDGPPTPIASPDVDHEVQVKDMNERLASLSPPRKHYQRYFSSRGANGEMLNSRQGLSDFLRAYFHGKSGDWSGNEPFPLAGWTAEELAKMPGYYVMELEDGMAEAVAPFMPSAEEVRNCSWLPDEDLQFYVQEFGRTGFQGGLQWYRCSFETEQLVELSRFHAQTIDVPACFIGGGKDWGVFQKPRGFQKMQTEACSNMRGVDLIPNAGHWVQQEKPEEVAMLLVRFLRRP